MAKSCQSIPLDTGLYQDCLSSHFPSCNSISFNIFFQTVSNFGSLLGRMALSVIWIDDIWALNLLTGTFMAYFMFESIYLTIPNIWVIFIFVFLVEFISDYTVLNVFYRLSNETPPNHQVFAVCSISIGITIGVIAAGAIAIPMHAAICKMPAPY